MADVKVSGRIVVSTLQKSFFKEFGLRIRVYDGSSFAESSLTLAQVRKKKGDSKGISIARNIKIGNLENKFDKEFGIKIQIAGSDDSYLCDDNLTLKAAFVEDEKKLGRKARKEAKNTDASETTSDKNIKSEIGNDNSKTYFINHDKSRDACTIIWETDEYNIKELEPYISSIQCDDGEDFHELINSECPDSDGRDDFKVLELNNFEAVEGDDDNAYILCFHALISTDLNKHPIFSKALKKADNHVVARIQFKKDGKPIVDEDGYEEYLFEMGDDVTVEFELDD